MSEYFGQPGDGSGYRDRPLSFQWQSPLGFVEAIGLSATHLLLSDVLLGTEVALFCQRIIRVKRTRPRR